MKKLLLTFALLLAVLPAVSAWEVPKETLTYDIMYKWGPARRNSRRS